jgi:serine/threonine-protein kinase
VSVASIPQTIGRYRIEGILGEGAMAVVYAGFDPDIERRVAIKCLHREVADDPDYRRRFLVEARAAGHLTHPHIVTVFDAGETDDGRPYIAMERLTGETLASRVATHGLPPLPTIIELTTQVAAALDYAHTQGVIHHDIKPDNIVLVDGWHHAKISDFGIAERRGKQDGHASKRIGGTPAYMAPERLRGEKSGARSDLFSLGVVLHWLVTGKLPWPDHEDIRQTIAERQQPLPPVEPRDPAAPSMLVHIVGTLLAPTIEARYQRGAEVVDDLRVAQREYDRLQEQPLVNHFVSLRLRWAGVLGAILTMVLILGLALIYGKQNRAVTGLAFDFGGSMAHMIASESAENLLLGDRAATRALVEDVARNQQIHYLAIADHDGNVVASTRANEIGLPLPPINGKKYESQASDIQSYLSPDKGAGQDDVLLFDVPVLYQVKTVGQLRLGVSNAPLHAAQKTTLGVILTVLLVTLTVVMGAAYWLFRRPLILLGLVSDALLRVARGDFGYRIRLVRGDELGRLFVSFNLMNTSLQNRRRLGIRPARRVPAESATQPTRILPVSEKDDAG